MVGNEQQKTMVKLEKRRELRRHFRLLKNPFALIFYVVMMLYVVALLLPVAWLIFSSFRGTYDFEIAPFALNGEYSFINYRYVFEKLYIQIPASSHKAYFVELFYNGLSYALLLPIPGLFVNICVAYVCTKYKSVFTEFLYAFVLVQMLIPIVGTLPSKILLYRNLGIYNNFVGILVSCAGFGGTNFLILYGVLKALPNSLSEAAEIDGASRFTVLFRIVIPMLMTTLIGLYILAFIAAWNDFETPMVFLPSRPTLAYGLWKFQSSSDSYISQIPVQLAAVIVVMLPVFVLFVCLKNKIMGNLVLGSVKG